MTPWVLLAVAILMEVGATLALRASDGLTNWVWAIPVAIGYVGSLVLLALVLRLGMPVGVAYAVWAACGVVLTAVLSHFLFGEALTWVMAGGIALIGAGVALVELGG
jgi:small multidrug resistance pump